LLVTGGWLVVLAGLTIWLSSTDGVRLRDQLRHWQFWFLETQFVLLVVLSLVNVRRYAASLSIGRRDVGIVAALSLLAIVVAGGVAPRTNRIFYDEQIYQGIGQNLSDLRLAQMCNDGTVEYGVLQCWRGEYNKQPYGYPYLLSVLYRAAGVSYWAATGLNVGIAALLVIVVFLIARALFEDPRAAWAAALIAALMPEQLIWSHTAAAEPSAALFAAVAVLAALHFVRARTWIAVTWVVVATAFALQFRTESIVVVPVVALAIALWAPMEYRGVRLWGAALLGVVLSAALIAHLFAVRNEPWGSAGNRFSLGFVAGNVGSNGHFYLGDARFPVVYTLLALVALARVRQWRGTAFCLMYFFVFWATYLLFYAGSYDYGADVRYSLMTFPPLMLLAGAGAAEAMTALRRFVPSPRQAAAIVGAALAFQFLWYLPTVRAVGEEAWAARADVAYAERIAPTLPANSIVLTHNPSVFHLLGRNAAQLSLATNEPGYVTNVLLPRYRGGVYIHWNFWCNVSDPVQHDFCTRAMSRFPGRRISEYRERDYRYAFYRIDTPPPAAR
jgi:hypothetical protein